jgi:hypothetical protein
MYIQSQPYDECYDCGSPMTTPLNTDECSSNIYVDGVLKEVKVHCTGCGGRGGFRMYQPNLHGEV